MRASPRDLAELVALLLIVGGSAILLTRVSARLAARASQLVVRIT